MRDRELVEALRMRALPEGSDEYQSLLDFLRLYRDAVQMVVNKVWVLDKTPSISALHKMFYSELRVYGFRSHHVKQVYVYAKAIVKAVKRNGGRKPILRRLTARIDKYDYRLDLESRTLVLKVHENRDVRLRLLTSEERIRKFMGWDNYELAVKVVGDDIYIAVYFRRSIKLRKPRTVMTVDINFDNITLAVFTASGKLVKLKRFKTPLREILTHRIWIERTQKRYPRSWRFIRGVRESIRKHGERVRSIAWDYAHRIGDLVAEIADRYSAIIVLENLNHLRDNVNGSSSFNKRLSLWFYRRLQFTISYEALERVLEVKHVNPRGTSSTCPRCGSKLKDNGSRILYCTSCGFAGDRDVIACVNLFSKYSRCGGSGVPLNTPKPNENPSGMQGNKDEAMTSTHINLYQS